MLIHSLISVTRNKLDVFFLIENYLSDKSICKSLIMCNYFRVRVIVALLSTSRVQCHVLVDVVFLTSKRSHRLPSIYVVLGIRQPLEMCVSRRAVVLG